MRAIKRINNNVVVCLDASGRELIAMGKGIGFGEIPREITLSQIERTFYDVSENSQNLLGELSPEVISFAAQLIDIARNELPYGLSPNAVFPMADHISFAIERAKKGIRVSMPLSYDIEQMYQKECKLGRYALKRIRKEFYIQLPDQEAVGIAMNLINSKIENAEEQAQNTSMQDAEVLDEITELVEGSFHIMIDRESFNYSRFATHVQYLFQRIHSGKGLNSDNSQMYRELKKEFPGISDCADEIAELIAKEWNESLSEEEKLYLILHINRICSRE